ncbi:MAG: hemolysin III family protein [Smithellaceae bacterium]|nr:hemolysin III family protein [Smithellaceae bacterium]
MQEKRPVARAPRSQSRGEEIANSTSHGLGLLAATASAPLLIISAVQRGDKEGIIGASIFVAAMLLMYLTSTIYHALPRNSAKRVFQLLDHGAIYLLIAGTYTPFTLGVLSGAWGYALLGIVWSLALIGVILKALGGVRFPLLSTALYLAMGWLIVIAAKPLWLSMPGWGLFWLAAGGLAYSVGVIFYATGKRIRYAHFIWHLFVVAGTACHFIAVMNYSV